MSFTATNYRNMSNEELVRYTSVDNEATDRERILADRLDNALAYIAQVTVFLAENGMLEPHTSKIQ